MENFPIPEQIDEQKITQERIKDLGGQLHDEWRKPRWREGTKDYEPRIKQTKDEEWSNAHGGSIEVDIANTSYENLPSEWQEENKMSAEVAINEVEKAIENDVLLDDSFIEEASSMLHDKWLERNGGWAPSEQNKPYSELTEEEKEKDRVIIRKAIEVCVKEDFDLADLQDLYEPGGFKDQYGLDSQLFVVDNHVKGTLKIGGDLVEFNGEPTVEDMNKFFEAIRGSFNYRGDRREGHDPLYQTSDDVVGVVLRKFKRELGI